ncbi:MAG: hypothetical protein H0X26_00125 [Alphaproteobacteria bacterium]|nr:hypothetical protein [Alphaproteobacteria bacterium]
MSKKFSHALILGLCSYGSLGASLIPTNAGAVEEQFGYIYCGPRSLLHMEGAPGRPDMLASPDVAKNICDEVCASTNSNLKYFGEYDCGKMAQFANCSSKCACKCSPS